MSFTIRMAMFLCAVCFSILTPLPCLRRLHTDVVPSQSVAHSTTDEVLLSLHTKLAEAEKKLVAVEALLASSSGDVKIRPGVGCKFPNLYDNKWSYSCSPEGTCPYEIDLHTGVGLRYIACKSSTGKSPIMSMPALDSNSEYVMQQLHDVWSTIPVPSGNTVANSSDIRNYFNSHKVFLDKVPKWSAVSDRYSTDAGVVFFAGGERFLSALATALYIKVHLGSILPIEIWKDSNRSEGYPSEPMIKIAEAHEITFRTLPSKYGTGLYTWDDQWVVGEEEPKPVMGPNAVWMSMKPMIILASRFETVIFFDDDAISIVQPESFLNVFKENPKATAIFWRDVWAMFSDSYIWEYLPASLDVQHPMPSQDSGVLVIKKSQSWEALALTVFLNINHKVFYPMIYFDPSSGHTAFGTGDKDTFQVAWMASGTAYHLMPPLSLVGAHRWRCGSTLGQPGHNTTVAVLHMNSFKLRANDYFEGKWKKWFEVRPKAGFAVQSAYVLNNPAADANKNDGKNHDQIKWSGARKSGAARCLKWLGHFREESMESISGRQIGPELRTFFENVFASPWAENFIRNLPQR